MSELSDLVKFFHLCRGRAHSFRYKNWLDYKSCDAEEEITPFDQILGVGNGVTTDFQLQKTYELYGLPELSIEKPIYKPVSNTIVVSADNTPLTINTNFIVNYSTGIVSITPAPLSGVVLRWGGEFDLPCRFDIDELQVSMDFYEHGSTNIPIVEVRI